MPPRLDASAVAQAGEAGRGRGERRREADRAGRPVAFVVIPRWSFCWETPSPPRWGRASVSRAQGKILACWSLAEAPSGQVGGWASDGGGLPGPSARSEAPRVGWPGLKGPFYAGRGALQATQSPPAPPPQ